MVVFKGDHIPKYWNVKNRINQSAPGKTIKRKIQLSLKVFENFFIISSFLFLKTDFIEFLGLITITLLVYSYLKARLNY